ncbi:SIS domain-containing protein [Kaarinaea lacus]
MKASLIASSNDFNKLIRNGNFTTKQGQALSLEQGSCEALTLLSKTKENSGNVYIVGNGGSAAVASHIHNDFCNVGGLRAMTLHEPAVLTCFSNDYGYERAYSTLIEKMAGKNDLLIAISSSGQSKNIINAALAMRTCHGSVITLTGFSANNPLRLSGDLNFWVNSKSYGLVEIAHLFTLHHWSDRIGVEWEDSRKVVSIVN